MFTIQIKKTGVDARPLAATGAIVPVRRCFWINFLFLNVFILISILRVRQTVYLYIYEVCVNPREIIK